MSVNWSSLQNLPEKNAAVNQKAAELGKPVQELTSNEIASALGSSSSDLSGFRLLENIPVPVDWIGYLLIAKLIKEKPELLAKIVDKWLDAEADMVHALAQAGAGNIITAWAHSHLIAMILEQNYMIRKGGAAGLVSGMNWLTGAEVASSFLSILGAHFGDINVPQSLVFSGRKTTRNIPVSREIEK